MDDVQGLVRSLLSQAHRKISNGEAMAALEDVVEALKLMGGDGAVLPALQRAREAFSSGQRASMEQMQQLGKLFNDISLETEKRMLQSPAMSSDCAEMEGPSSNSGSSNHFNQSGYNMSAVVPEDCILSETGREGITACALGDGSSFICERCGAVVGNTRRDAHNEFWCEGTT